MLYGRSDRLELDDGYREVTVDSVHVFAAGESSLPILSDISLIYLVCRHFFIDVVPVSSKSNEGFVQGLRFESGRVHLGGFHVYSSVLISVLVLCVCISSNISVSQRP